MKKQRWLSLVLILALVVGLCSVCAAAADDQTAEQPVQEAADTVAEAEAAETQKAASSWTRHYLTGLGVGFGAAAVVGGGYFIVKRRKRHE